MKRKIKFIAFSFIIISSIYVINTSTSRYLSEINLKSDVEVAIPQIELEDINYTSDKMLPGDTKSVYFNIKNYKNSEINEVLMEYYIDLDIQENSIPFTYEIYEVNNTAETKLNQSSTGFGPVSLNYGTEQTKYFKIVFTWNQSDKEVVYANKQFKFKIGINAEQVI